MFNHASPDQIYDLSSAHRFLDRWPRRYFFDAGQCRQSNGMSGRGFTLLWIWIFVIGDTALVTGPDGKPVPGIAPAAKQQGEYAASVIRAGFQTR